MINLINRITILKIVFQVIFSSYSIDYENISIMKSLDYQNHSVTPSILGKSILKSLVISTTVYARTEGRGARVSKTVSIPRLRYHGTPPLSVSDNAGPATATDNSGRRRTRKPRKSTRFVGITSRNVAFSIQISTESGKSVVVRR